MNMNSLFLFQYGDFLQRRRNVLVLTLDQAGFQTYRAVQLLALDNLLCLYMQEWMVNIATITRNVSAIAKFKQKMMAHVLLKIK